MTDKDTVQRQECRPLRNRTLFISVNGVANPVASVMDGPRRHKCEKEGLLQRLSKLDLTCIWTRTVTLSGLET